MIWIAQIAQDVDSIKDWLQLITSGGFTALAWYLIARALPDMQKRFDQTSAAQLATFEKSLETCREDFNRQMEMQRTYSKDELKMLAESYERHIDKLLSRGGGAG